MNGFKVKNSVEVMDYTGNLSVKALNRVAVLRVLLFGGPASRLDISTQTGLSTATVSRVVSALIDEGLIEEVGISQTGMRGYPPIVLQFRGNIGYAVGIDIGESYIRFELVNLLGETIDTARVTTEALVGGDVTLEQLLTGFKRLLRKNALAEKDIWGVGVGVPGVVNSAGVVKVPDIVGWWNYPLQEKLLETLKTNVILEKGANCSALGEYMYGHAKSANSAVFFRIGAGIGGGIIINGKMLTGHNNAAGEFGFIMPFPEAPPLDSKKHGLLEEIVGLHSNLDLLRTAGVGVADESNIPFMQMICHCATEGDSACMEFIQKNIRFFGQAAVNIAAVVNPEIVIIGGDIYPMGEIIRSGIEDYMKKFLPYPPQVLLTKLGLDAALKGASRIALESSLVRFGVVSPTEAAGEY